MFHRKPRQALRLQRCQNKRLGYGYIRGRKISGNFFFWCGGGGGGGLGAENGEIKVCCLEKSWRCRDTRFGMIRG